MAQLNLYCAEDGWDEEEDCQEKNFSYSSHAPSLPPPLQNLSCTLVDEHLFSEHHELREKPWMTQLAVVACLSLATKVEESQVPLLLELQVEEAQFVFEAN
ncbi:Cyclin-D4-1 [Nymphaea thermarum]|nr:Cyclin-D4-1 [Nymphaea thermarum]